MNTVATATRTLPASSQRIVPEKFAHVVLKTANYDAVIAWYATVLQARVAFRNAFIAFLTYDDEHHRVAVLNTPGSPAPDPAAAGVHHIAYTYTGLGELLATYRRLKASGIEPARCINHGPTTSMYYRDPDGLRVELQIDNFATMDEGHGNRPGQEIGDLDHREPLPGVRILGRLRDGIHGSRDHVVVREVGDGVLHRHGGQQRTHRLVHGGNVFAALAPRGEARVVLPLGFSKGAAHARPVMLVSGHDQDPTVLAGEHATGS